MEYMTELTAIAKTHGGIIETKIAAQHGISKAMLYKLCKEEKIHRIVKGQYILPDDMQDEMLSISKRSENIIFSHETALYLHGISDRTPFEHTVTAPSGCIPSMAIKSECKVYYIKGYKDKLVKLDDEGNVANRTSKNQPDFKNINSYAVNGAVHYANAVLHYTSYTDVIAIGVTGCKEANGRITHLIGVYYVSKSNFGVGQKVDEYTDLSFLKKEYFSAFIEKVKQLSLPQDEIEKLKERREQEITASLVKLNNDIFKNETGLSENDRVYLVVASIMATLGDVDNNVYPLTKADLKSSDERNNTDGDIMIRKIESFLDAKKLPKDKKDLIVRTLQNTLTTDNINTAEDGESQLKRVFIKIVDDLGIYYKIGLTTDFTGKLFNEMYSWLGFTQDQLNDVVLTPPYVATLLCRLARVNKDSFDMCVILKYKLFIVRTD